MRWQNDGIGGLGYFPPRGERAAQMKMQLLIDSKGKDLVFWSQKKDIGYVGKV
jgi:hypothetical protein